MFILKHSYEDLLNEAAIKIRQDDSASDFSGLNEKNGFILYLSKYPYKYSKLISLDSYPEFKISSIGSPSYICGSTKFIITFNAKDFYMDKANLLGKKLMLSNEEGNYKQCSDKVIRLNFYPSINNSLSTQTRVKDNIYNKYTSNR